jgi:hypothetical protein
MWWALGTRVLLLVLANDYDGHGFVFNVNNREFFMLQNYNSYAYADQLFYAVPLPLGICFQKQIDMYYHTQIVVLYVFLYNLFFFIK